MKITISDTISTRKIGDEIFIFDRKLSKIHNLNKMAAFIWERIKEDLNKKEITDRIIERFEVGRNTAESDLEKYISELHDKKLITINNCSTDDKRE